MTAQKLTPEVSGEALNQLQSLLDKARELATELKEKRASIHDSFVFFNNHFAGFGPESVNEFRRLLGMIEVGWSKGQESTQATL